jgi:hypothetical protein
VDAKAAAAARLKPPLDASTLSTAYVADPIAAINDELVYPEFTANVAEEGYAAAPLDGYPWDKANVGSPVTAGVFQFIPILLHKIGDVACAHVIGALTSSHWYSSL